MPNFVRKTIVTNLVHKIKIRDSISHGSSKCIQCTCGWRYLVSSTGSDTSLEARIRSLEHQVLSLQGLPDESSKVFSLTWAFNTDVRLAAYEVHTNRTLRLYELNRVRFELGIPQDPLSGYMVDENGKDLQE